MFARVMVDGGELEGDLLLMERKGNALGACRSVDSVDRINHVKLSKLNRP